MNKLLLVEHKREETCHGGADSTLTVTHLVEVHTPNVVRPLLEIRVQEFQLVYTVHVYRKGRAVLFISDRYYPVLGWLGKKWHQWMEQRFMRAKEEKGVPPDLDRYGCMAVCLGAGSMIVMCWLISSGVAWLLGGR